MSQPLFDRGFISSPGYGESANYNRDLHCEWPLAAQRHQHLRITVYDFALTVNSGGTCQDYLQLVAGSGEGEGEGDIVFTECGLQGKQTIEVKDRNALVRFHTTRKSSTARGFLLFFEGDVISPPLSHC